MQIMITGANGQLGQALLRQLPGAIGIARPAVDITDAEAVERAVAAHRPDVIIHAAALTDVDGAARDPELAFRINGLGTQAVALAAARHGAAVAYVSSNEVFDGAAGRPYTEFDPVRPINAYGASKLAGEWFVQHLLQRFYIVRTAWVTGPGGATSSIGSSNWLTSAAACVSSATRSPTRPSSMIWRAGLRA